MNSRPASGASGIVDDGRAALRSIRFRPGFALTVILILGMALGLCAAMFTLVHALLIRPLPYKDAERLVAVWNRYSHDEVNQSYSSPPDYRDRLELSHSFSSMGAWRSARANLTSGGEPVRIATGRVTASFFTTLGVRPILGRTFVESEDQPGGGSPVVLNERLWKARFGSDDAVLGKTIVIDGVTRTVVGVMPAKFAYPDRETEAWVPIALAPESFSDDQRGNEFLGVVARLQDGVALESARAELNVIAAGVLERVPTRAKFLNEAGWGAIVTPLRDEIVGDVRPALLVLFGAVGLVLLIACANTTNLILVRNLERRGDLEVRIAIGAPRWRVVRQLVFESVALGVLAGLTGIAVSKAALRIAGSLASDPLVRDATATLDLTAVLFAMTVAVAASFAIGSLPALLALRGVQTDAGRHGARLAGRTGANGVRSALVIAEIALSFALLVVGMLLVKSLDRLLAVQPGFDSSSRLTMQLSLPDDSYGDRERRLAFIDELSERLGSLPGVRETGVISELPLSGADWTASFHLDRSIAGESPGGHLRAVSADYFAASGTRVLSGRTFAGRDGATEPLTIIVDEAAARLYWPGVDAVGKHLTFSNPDEGEPVWREIVGVVSGVRDGSLDTAAEPHIYLPIARSVPSTFSIVAWLDGDPALHANSFRSVVKDLDPLLPAGEIRPMSLWVSESVARPRFQAVIVASFALFSLLLAIVGVHTVVAYSALARRRELAVHSAVGATPWQLFRRTLRWGASLALWGIAVGLAGALAGERFVRGIVFGVTTLDIGTWVGSVAVLGLLIVAASFGPALRSRRIDPASVLRAD